jgi:hypothetical protein
VLTIVPCLVALALALPGLGSKSLWFDELFSANAILLGHYIPEQLGTTPLGLAVLAGTVVSLTARTEFWLRAVPFAFGLGSVVLVSLLAHELYRSRLALLLAGLLLATNLTALTYFREVKHYTAEMFFAALLLLLAERTVKRPTPTRWTSYAGAAVAAPLFSYGSLFVTAATSTVLLVASVRRDRRRGLQTWLTYHALPVVLVGPYLLGFVRFQRSPTILAYWAESRSEPGLAAMVIYYSQEGGRLLSFLFAPLQREAGLERFIVPVVMIATLLVGALLAARRQPRYLVLSIGPLLAAAGAAQLDLYPFNASRVLLFALPGLIVLAAGGVVGALCAASRLQGRRLAALVLALAALPLAQSFYILLVDPSRSRVATPTEHVPEMVSELRSQLRPNDLVYVYFAAKPALQFYAPELYWLPSESPGQSFPSEPYRGLREDGVRVVLGSTYPNLPEAYWTEVRSLVDERLADRFWVLIGHRREEDETAIVAAVSACATQEYFRRLPGAALYRFRLSDQACSR